MPAPNSASLKEQIDKAVNDAGEAGPRYAIEMLIEREGWSPVDALLAYVAPEALDAQSTMTEREDKHYQEEKAEIQRQADAADGNKQRQDATAAEQKAKDSDAKGADRKPVVGGTGGEESIDSLTHSQRPAKK